jgi:catechol 2,3-dioxygenase-like lactoylglutathione lyase family enzyme
MTIDPVIGWFEFALDVKDIARSEAFYRKLGFEVVIRETKGTRVTLENGECRVGLYQGHLNPTGPQLIFWQGDNFALGRELEGKGPVWDRGPSRNADNGHSAGGIYDPEGRFLYFINIPGLERVTAA